MGQNFLTHRPTIRQISALVSDHDGSILELGAGDGALTRPLSQLGRPVTAIDIDPRRVQQLRRSLPGVRVEHADALHHPLAADGIVGNVPFGLTTPILRRLLATGGWRYAVLLVQWEVARKRAGVGGGTMLTAQSAPWYEFSLITRVPARHFTPQPSVDGGILMITRRRRPLVPAADRRAYERFVKAVFTGRGGSLPKIIANATGAGSRRTRHVLRETNIVPTDLPRDLTPRQWRQLWHQLADPRTG
ncbi:23S ribosomal RNA methyltransferase Erm [Naumannella halotolerans]|uniref:23S ribosomal RNA methyltransferase Erm n=1 Tax=Naumannella halotolerans TaxID=993414 RepID=UPI001FB9C858|nr:23S ribosomal RNA methyltransferase Erm [Naumannella halotolerans]